MKAVIIGASGEALHTIEKAHEHGLSITALDGNPEAEGLRAADKALVVDISDENAAIEAVQKEKPDFVLTVPIGRYLTTIGAVNDALKLPGISRETAVLCTDKYKFHHKLQEANLRNCHCYRAGSREEEMTNEELADSFLSGKLPLNFPVIVKPRFGSGSRGIHMAADMEELLGALKAAEGEAYVVEECIPGEEYGVDGAVIQGQFHMILLRKKENTPPPARQAIGYFSVLPEDIFWRQVFDYMKKLAECLGLSECLLHADIIRGEKGPFVIELSARPSGHNLHNLFTPLCTGIDMAEEYIKYRLGQSYCFTPANTRQMMIHYFDMEGCVAKVPDERQLKEFPLIDWECNVKEGEKLPPVSDGHSLMGRGYFILEGKNQAVLLMQAEKIKNLFFS